MGKTTFPSTGEFAGFMVAINRMTSGRKGQVPGRTLQEVAFELTQKI